MRFAIVDLEEEQRGYPRAVRVGRGRMHRCSNGRDTSATPHSRSSPFSNGASPGCGRDTMDLDFVLAYLATVASRCLVGIRDAATGRILRPVPI